VKDLVIIFLLALTELACVDLGGHHGSEIDPRRTESFFPGVTSLKDAIEIFGREPASTSDSEDGGVTAVWYSVFGNLSEPETLRVEYSVEARFDSDGKLIRVSAVDHRSNPDGRWDTLQAVELDTNVSPRSAPKRSAQ